MISATRSAVRNSLLPPLVQLSLGMAVAGAVGLRVGVEQAGSVAIGACVVALGYLVFGWRTALRPPVVPAGRVFVRLILGAILKWLTIAAGLVLALSADGLQPVYVLVGAGSAWLAFFLCLPWLLR